MDLAIKKLMLRGIAAHKNGKLKEAKRLYRAVLKMQPTHPDANHNLGVLMVSVGKIEKALSFFKLAIEANPKGEQFWLSYIDALIQGQQFEGASQAFLQAQKQGIDNKKLSDLTARLSQRFQTKNNKSANPPQEQLKVLLELFQKGQLIDAENIAISISREYPRNPFPWKVLGAIFDATNRKFEAVQANQKAVELAPQDAEAHNNLGITLHELVRLDEAEACFRQAIKLKPEYAQAHGNLANALKGLGRQNEAEVSYRRVTLLKPDSAQAHSNLGLTLKEIGKFTEAEKSFSKAIALQPDYAEAHNNLGVTFRELGRADKAEASFKQAIALKSDFSEAFGNLGNILQEAGRLEEAEDLLKQAIALKPDYCEGLYSLSVALSYMNNLAAEIVSLRDILHIASGDLVLRARVHLAICNFLDGNFRDSEQQLLAASGIQKIASSEVDTEKAYHKYLKNILNWHKANNFVVMRESNDQRLFAIGESHSLTSHHLRVAYLDRFFFCSAQLIKGCKQWHLGNKQRNQYKNKFESIFCALPQNSYVLLAIGEIDCRLDTGIIAHHKKRPKKHIKEIICNTVENYLTYILDKNTDHQHRVIIQGVPCPNIETTKHSLDDIEQLVSVIELFNFELKTRSKLKGFGFLDTYRLTNRGDGISNGTWHIDDFHLSPEGMQEAWRRHAFPYR